MVTYTITYRDGDRWDSPSVTTPAATLREAKALAGEFAALIAGRIAAGSLPVTYYGIRIAASDGAVWEQSVRPDGGIGQCHRSPDDAGARHAGEARGIIGQGQHRIRAARGKGAAGRRR